MITVCADDFAQDDRVNEAVLRLLGAGRLSAVSSFTDAPTWKDAGPRLRDQSAGVLLGLHLNLTEPFGHGERPLAAWIARALAGAVDAADVRDRLRRQLDNFVLAIGRLPDFIDGHHHVHVFPVVRSVVQESVVALRREHPVRVRSLARFVGGTDAPIKRRFIRWIAGFGSAADLASDFLLNTGFGGDYSLRPDANYARLFSGWLSDAPDGSLLMCHPAADPSAGQATAGGRELEFLLSARCEQLFLAHASRLARAADTARRPV